MEPGQELALRVLTLDRDGQALSGVRVRVESEGQVLYKAETDTWGTLPVARQALRPRGPVRVRAGSWQGDLEFPCRGVARVWMGEEGLQRRDGKIPVVVAAWDAWSGSPWREPLELWVDGNPHLVALDPQGLASLDLPMGTRIRSSERLLSAPLMSTGDAGKDLALEDDHLVLRGDGPLYLEVWAGGHLAATPVLDGPSATWEIPSDLSGPLGLEAWRLESGSSVAVGRWRIEARQPAPTPPMIPEVLWSAEPWHVPDLGGDILWVSLGEDEPSSRVGNLDLSLRTDLPAWTSQEPGSLDILLDPMGQDSPTLTIAGAKASSEGTPPRRVGPGGLNLDLPSPDERRSIEVWRVSTTGASRHATHVQRLPVFHVDTLPMPLRVGDEIRIPFWSKDAQVPPVVAAQGAGSIQVDLEHDGILIRAMEEGEGQVVLVLEQEGLRWTWAASLEVLDRGARPRGPVLALLEQVGCPSAEFHSPSGGWSLYPGDVPEILSTAWVLGRDPRCGPSPDKDSAFLLSQQLGDGSFAPPGAYGRRLGRMDRDDRFLVTVEATRALLALGLRNAAVQRSVGWLEREIGFRRDPLALAAGLGVLVDMGRRQGGPLLRLEEWARNPKPPGLYLPYGLDMQASVLRLEQDASRVLGRSVSLPTPESRGPTGTLDITWDGGPLRVGQKTTLRLHFSMIEGLPAVLVDAPANMVWDESALTALVNQGQARTWGIEGRTLAVHLHPGTRSLSLPMVARAAGSASTGPILLWDAASRRVIQVAQSIRADVGS